MSKGKKADPEFVLKIVEDSDDAPHFFACIPQQIQSGWHEKWGPMLEGFPLNILYARIANQAKASSAMRHPSAEFEPQAERLYPEKEPCMVIVGGIHPRQNFTSKKWLPTQTSSRPRRFSAEVCYWPDLATFREDSEHKETGYFTNPMDA